MENRSLYTILFKGLSLGSHDFDWAIDGSFFESYELSEISYAYIDVQLTLVKRSHFLELDFVFDGWVEVNCDRCLEPMKLDMASKARMYVKFDDCAGEDSSDDDLDVIVLSHDQDRLDVAQYLYEYAHLSLPIRRVHPDDVNGCSACNADMIRTLEQYLVKDKP